MKKKPSKNRSEEKVEKRWSGLLIKLPTPGVPFCRVRYITGNIQEDTLKKTRQLARCPSEEFEEECRRGVQKRSAEEECREDCRRGVQKR